MGGHRITRSTTWFPVIELRLQAPWQSFTNWAILGGGCPPLVMTVCFLLATLLSQIVYKHPKGLPNSTPASLFPLISSSSGWLFLSIDTPPLRLSPRSPGWPILDVFPIQEGFSRSQGSLQFEDKAWFKDRELCLASWFLYGQPSCWKSEVIRTVCVQSVCLSAYNLLSLCCRANTNKSIRFGGDFCLSDSRG